MIKPSWGALALFAVLTRAATLLTGWFCGHYLPPVAWKPAGPGVPQSLVQTFHHWDSSWYLKIAVDGYDYQPGAASTVAFMPGLPVLIMAAMKCGFDPVISALVIPNIAFVVGLMYFGRWLVAMGRDDGTVWRACLLLAAYPTSFFFSCPYQESLGFAGVAFALWAWQSERWYLAAFGIFVASTARLTALAFPAGLAVEWLIGKVRHKPTKTLGKIGLVSLAWLAAVTLFALHCYENFGEPLAHLKAHSAWGRLPPHPQNVLTTLRQIRDDQDVTTGAVVTLFTFLGLRAWHRRGAFAGLLILIPILQAASTGTSMSLERVVLASFPAFLDCAEILKKRRVFLIFLTASTIMSIANLNAYVHWQFVG